jgi:predicted transcriptional regulator
MWIVLVVCSAIDYTKTVKFDSKIPLSKLGGLLEGLIYIW